MKELLSPLQKRILSVAITFISVLAIVGIIVLFFVVLSNILSYFSKVIWPLVIALIFALLLRPIIKYTQRRLHFSTMTSVILIYFGLVVLISGILIFALPLLFEQLVTLIKFIPQLITQVFDFLESRFPSIVTEFKVKIYELTPFKNAQVIFEKLATYLPTVWQAGTNLFGFFTWIVALAVTPIYLFYILTMKSSFLGRLEKELTFMKQTWRNDLIFLLRKYTEIIESFFRGQLLIGLLMGILLTIGFYTIGLQFALILGISIGLLNIIPYLGTIIGLGTVIPIAFFQEGGSWIMAIMAVGVFCIVQVIESYLLTPKIMGDKTGLHPLVIILSLFFWGTALDGILGMILAIPLTASLVVTWYLIKKKYLLPKKIENFENYKEV